MLLYAGTYCDSGAWRAPKWGCCQPTSSPQPGMYVLLSFVTSFFIQVVYMSLIHYFIWNWHICYFICRPLVRHPCVKSTKPMAHLWQASRYAYVDRFLCTFVYLFLWFGAWRDPNWWPTSSPPRYMSICWHWHIYFLCILIVSKWCLKSAQSGSLLVRHHNPPLPTHVQ